MDRDRLNIALFALLLVVALLPTIVTPIPAMVDYINHLARMYVLAADGTAGASPFYRVEWALYPNLAMDLVVPPLARLLGVETATRVFLVTSQLLVVAGAVAIELAVKRRFAFAGLCALLWLYSVPIAWGFVNFVFGLGVALLGIAAWMALRKRPWALRFTIHALFVALLFVSHLVALGIYGFALGLHELWTARAERLPFRRLAATMAMLAAPVLPLLALMQATGGSVGEATNIWLLAAKPFWLVATLNGYSVALSAVGSLALFSLLYALGRRGCLRLEASGAWLLAGFGFLYLALPSRMLDTAFVDLRIVLAVALILPAFLTIRFPGERWRHAATAMVAGLVLTNTACAARIDAAYSVTYRAMIDSFGRLPAGSRVLVAHAGAAEDPPLADLSAYPIYHAPTLAVAYAKAFVPTLFTCAGKQPIVVRPAERRLANACGGPVPMAMLKAAVSGAAPEETPPFLRNWQRDFDYVYAVGAETTAPMPDGLAPILRDPRFTLYKVVKQRSMVKQDRPPGE